jgi:murein DD-endopeptidase MepM/ murein hydrolase activator NlpD
MAEKKYKGLVIDWPLDSNKIRGGKVSNTFGETVRHRADGTTKPHQGWDFTTKDGDHVYAIADGVVCGVEDRGDYGKQLTIRHAVPAGGFIYSFYAHLNSIDVAVGISVKRGQAVCKAGSSGNAASLSAADKHLHFEVRDKASCGLGCKDRQSPFVLFGQPPLKETVKRGE